MADVLHRFREDISVKLTSTTPQAQDRTDQLWDGHNTVLLRDRGALHLSFTYPDQHKAQDVAADLVQLYVEENLRLAQRKATEAADGAIHNHVVVHVADPPHQVPAGPNLIEVMSFGLGVGALAGAAIAMLRRRIQPAP